MDDVRNKFIGRLTPGKLGLIIVLAIVLLVVIVLQNPGMTSGRAVVASRADGLPTAPTAAELFESVMGVSRDPVQDWPEISRREVLSHDPFGVPSFLRVKPVAEAPPRQTPDATLATQAAEPERKAARQNELLASLRSQGVNFVYLGAGKKLARVGELSLREGDLLEGLRVVEIHTRGIVLAAEPERPAEDRQPETTGTESAAGSHRAAGLSLPSLGINWLVGRMKKVWRAKYGGDDLAPHDGLSGPPTEGHEESRDGNKDIP